MPATLTHRDSLGVLSSVPKEIIAEATAQSLIAIQGLHRLFKFHGVQIWTDPVKIFPKIYQKSEIFEPVGVDQTAW